MPSAVVLSTPSETATPVLVVTPGEPAGIGPDLVVACAQDPALAAAMVVVSDPALLRERAERLGLTLRQRACTPGERPPASEDGSLRVWPVPLEAPVTPGATDTANAAHVLATLDLASDACRDGHADAMVTGPVQKSVILEAGHDFSGHTEYLAARTGAALPVMMLVAPGARPAPLRVALVTTHLPLRAVPDAITRDRVEATLAVLDAALRRDFGMPRPRIAVTGLNPHAGEAGHLGDEEARVIAPAIAAAQRDGIAVHGPLPADTLFTPRHLADCDAVLAMYHDQGLAVLKYAGFGTAVNITLGLPIVRVSVDHGTALDLAGSGHADAGSFRAALREAAAISATRIAA
ncbi:MAG: 4-hydroxythreonine-4-phosphate dehydrogenase PdxA [Algiphilus sp.]|nr:4-hydroxythreonine-4-phosphate dehydrogenase PdxA [Algiphilus sp.]